ncbi:MAG: hypothetical protein V1679_02360 [Candidatus Peregrinibacteria bacterium]
MKKILTTILITLLLIPAISGPILSTNATTPSVNIDDLVPKPSELGGDLGKDSAELQAFEGLVKVEKENIMATVIKTILKLAMALTIIGIVIAGIFYLQSQGKEEDVTKAKNILIYLAIGMAIMAGAYGIVSGIVQFDFFKAVQ